MTGYFLGIENAERTISYNVRAVLQGMRERGLRVESVLPVNKGGEQGFDGGDGGGDDDDDREILDMDGNGRMEGWVPVRLDG